MQNLIKISAAAALTLGLAQPALADTAETKGGITIKTDDGRFEAKIGGRIHLDFASLDNDDSPTYSGDGGAYFRRARLTLTGKAYGWEYKFENDFADAEAATACDAADPTDCETVGTNSFRDMYIATSLLGGKVTIGQFKPLRGMEEMTSSNEVTMVERPFASASGLFSGRQFAIGTKYEGKTESMTYGIALQNNSVLKGGDSRVTEEPVISGRVTFAPVNTDTTTVHLGASLSMENGSSTGARLRGRGKLPATDLGTSRTLAEAGAAGPDKDASHIGLEVGASTGPFYAQAEYIQASYSDAFDPGTGPEDADVVAYYLMASFMLTGEHKPYSSGVFKSPKPKGENGALELKARYDSAENKDQPTTATNQREISVLTVGANWYLNPNLRFMLEYSMGEDNTVADTPSGGNPEPKAVTLRTQFSF
ncbi:MAG: OprO/OprP family phosphate-selective porin [Nevskiaceae bacterium]